jgi:hypothetical protein
VHDLGRDQPKTTKELLDITTQDASGEEAVRDIFIQGAGKAVPDDSRRVPPEEADKGAKRSTKGNKRGLKQRLQRVTVTTNCDEDNNDKGANNSNEELIAAVEWDFKHQVQ